MFSKDFSAFRHYIITKFEGHCNSAFGLASMLISKQTERICQYKGQRTGENRKIESGEE